jgi:hypothetical protein
MIVDYFDFVSIAFAELEANPPRPVNGHRPLAFAITPKLVKPNAFERTQVVQSFGNVQGKQQIHRRLHIEPAELIRPFAFPHLPGHGIAPRPDHGKNVLRLTDNFKGFCNSEIS